MRFYFFLILCGLLSYFYKSHGALLKTISGNDLAVVSKANEFLLVLFVEPDCKPCKEFEIFLSQVSTEMMDALMDVTFVKVASNDIPRKLGIHSTPVCVFYRHQRPVIYDGAMEAEAIQNWITFNKELSMKVLNDDTFEHLTQAASGATTGDWLVLFCDPSNEACNNLEPIFETVASKLKGQKNVAFVDTAHSPSLVSRFSLNNDITIRFFRLGKMYSYSLEKLDIDSLTLFVQGWYKNMSPQNVPSAPSPFDSLVIQSVDMLKSYPWLKWLVPLSIVFAALAVLMRGSKPKTQKKKA